MARTKVFRKKITECQPSRPGPPGPCHKRKDQADSLRTDTGPGPRVLRITILRFLGITGP